MSAEILREAAALMRSRAEAATPGRWYPLSDEYEVFGDSPVSLDPEGDDFHTASMDHQPNREHIAGMDPTVALAVADWLEHEANVHEASVRNSAPADHRLSSHATRLATAYLGADA